MIFYRVEDNDKRGPYNIDQNKWNSQYHCPPMHPGPYSELESEELQDNFKYGMVFGFVSLTQLRAWFNGAELSRLANLGFRISVYELEYPGQYCKGYALGYKQAAFYQSCVRKIGEIKLLQEACQKIWPCVTQDTCVQTEVA